MKKKALAFGLLLCVASCRRDAEVELPPEDEIWLAPNLLETGAAGVLEARKQHLSEPLANGARIAFDDGRVTHVFSPVTGRVVRLVAQPGEAVKKGSPLAVLVSPDVGDASSDLVKARADLVAARHEHERQTQLLAVQAGVQRDLESAESTFRKAQAEEQRAEQRLSLFRGGALDAVTQEYALPSPVEGRVVARLVNPGVEVQGIYSGGTPVELFTVGETDVVWLYADIPETYLDDVKVGTQLKVRVLAFPGRDFAGKVDWVSPVLDPALRTVRVRASLSNPERLLKPEMYGTVYLHQPGVERLAVPRAALVPISDQTFVYVAAGTRPDGRSVFKRRRVQVRERDSRMEKGMKSAEPVSDAGPIAVLSGLADGERVLVQWAQTEHLNGNELTVTKAQLDSGRVTTSPAVQRDLPEQITLGARLVFADNRVTHVFPPVTGRVTQLMASPGQQVKKGTPLATLLSADLGAAFSDDLKARADLAAADKEAKRQREMFELHATARHDLEAAEDNEQRAKAEYERAAQKSRLLREGARDSVSQQYILRSPIEGEVVARSANPGLEVQGQYSGAGSVPELFTIGRLDELWMLADLYEVDLPYIKLGAEVELEVPAHPDRRFHGTVDWISDALDPATRTVKVRAVLRNPDGLLRPEMYGVARIAAPARQTVTVPRDAVLRVGDDTVVFVQGTPSADGRLPFRIRRVVANEELPGDAVPVLSGLQPGERVATTGAIFLLGLATGSST